MSSPMRKGAGLEPAPTTDERRAKDLLWSTPIGEGLTGDDLAFMFRLLLQHPSCEEKIGAGVARITVERNPRYPSSCGFVVWRIDGSNELFSYRKCLRGEPSHQSQVLAAMRREVDAQIVEVRRREFARGVRFCPYTRDVLTDPESVPHVHHAFSPFYSIAFKFVTYYGGFDRIDVDSAEGGGVRLRNQLVAKNWREYHKAEARLRVISKRANLSVLRTNPNAEPLFCELCGGARHAGDCT